MTVFSPFLVGRKENLANLGFSQYLYNGTTASLDDCFVEFTFAENTLKYENK